jgi:hypothetical protein
MPEDASFPGGRACPRTVLTIFGLLFLIALLAVPVVTTESRLREDPVTKIVTRTTFPRNTTMFLPRALTSGGRNDAAGAVRVRAAQWAATLGIVAFLGLLDYGLFCRLLRRRRPGRPDQIPPS